MEIVQTILSNHFTWGLALGLLIAAFIWKSSFSAKRNLKREQARVDKEMSDLQGHLNTQLRINASGNEKLQQELDELRGQNENLRVNIAQLQQKPGRAELRQLQILETAASRMREQAPGFAPAWEQALRDAEENAQSADSGLKKLVRKVIPALGTSSPAPAKDEDPSA